MVPVFDLLQPTGAGAGPKSGAALSGLTVSAAKTSGVPVSGAGPSVAPSTAPPSRVTHFPS